jgi:hypothetical protein
VLTGTEAGLFQVYSTRASGSGSIVKIRNLDGTSPALSSGAQVVAFYTLRMGVGVPLFGGGSAAGRAGLSVFEDGVQTGGAAYALRAGWAGTGAGVLVTANDSSFEALLPTAAGKGAIGPAIKIISYAPAYGVDVEVTGNPTDASAEGRGEFGVRVVSDTSAHDMTMAQSARGLEGRWQGAGVSGVQLDKDPAGVFVRNQSTSGSPSASTDLHPSALVVEDWGLDHAGAGRAINVRGDYYAWDGSSAYHDGSVTGRSIFAYADSYAAENSDLGAPDILHDSLTLDIVAPNYAEFNFSHDYVAVASSSVFTAPSRAVHGVLKGVNGGNLYEGTVIGARGDRLAVKAKAGSSTTPSTGGGFVLNGTRWYRAYLNIADYAFLGTGLTLTHRAHRSLLFVGSPLFDRTGTTDLDFTVSVAPEATDESLDSGAGKAASRVGAVAPGTAIANLDGGTYTDFNSNYRWTANTGAFYWEDSWTDAGLPAGSIQPDAENSGDDGQRSASTSADHVTAFNRDFFLLEGDNLTPSPRFGGSLQANRSSPGTISFAKSLGSYVRKDHLSVRVELRVAVVGSSDQLEVSLGTLSRDGADTFRKIAVGNVITLASVSGPERIEQHSVEINIHSESLFYNRDGDSHGASMDDQLLVVALEVGDAETLRVVEFEVHENQRPVYLHGPRVVTGSLSANKWRYTNAVRGFDTRGPQDASFLFGLDYALGGGIPHPGEYDRFGGPAAADAVGDQAHVKTKLKNTPWSYVDNENDVSVTLSESHRRIIYPNFDPQFMFFKGADAAAIAGATPAFDPAALVLDHTTRVSASITDRQLQVSFPGKTGFMVPVSPPHGSLLTSLLVNMSFLPGSQGASTHVNPANQDVYWGVYRAIGGWREGVLPTSTTTPISFESLISAGARTKWEDGAGVMVHLWRYRITGERLSGAQSGSAIDTYTQEAGYPELLWTKPIYLGDPPSASDLKVHLSVTPYPGSQGVYGMKESFVSRNYDLTQHSGVSDKPALFIVDRRRFSYFVTVEFYIGARTYEADGSISAIPEAGRNEWVNHDHPDYGTLIPSILSPTHGTWGANRSSTPFFDAFRWGQPGLPFVTNTTVPTVKFRGLRVGYLSSSPAHGGW